MAQSYKSTVKFLRKKVDHTMNTPRCATCIYFFRGGLETIHEDVVFQGPTCSIGPFRTAPVGLCDKWKNHNGEMLD